MPNFFLSGLADMMTRTWDRAVFRSRPDIKVLALESNSTALKIPHAKFKAVSSKDMGGVRFKAKTHAS